MYNVGDSTWVDQPKFMSQETVDELISRVAEHCTVHKNRVFTFGFHGGEPLLFPKERFSHFVESAREALEPNTKARFQIQTNGVLLTPEWCQLLGELNVEIGISLDGPREINDIHRLNHKGEGSYDAVRAGIENVKRAGLSFGILTVIDPMVDPERVFEHLVELGPDSVNLLLPEATHDQPPLHLLFETGEANVFGNWLLKFFKRWTEDKEMPFRVNRFDHIIGTVLGQIPPRDQAEVHRNEVIVIESDGSIEPVDVLKVCRSGITRTEMNVRTHMLDDAFHHELVYAYYASYDQVCETCENCQIRNICGGWIFAPSVQ